MSAENGFHRHLRHALNHLYEPDVLRTSRLIFLLLSPEQAQTSLALSRILTEAIESLKPEPGTSPEAPARQIYELLFYRYVHCAKQKDLAKQFTMSVRQIRREQSRALAVLAEYLRRHFNLSDADIQALDGPEQEQSYSEGEMGILSREFQWLQQSVPDEATNLSDELEAVQSVIEPFLRQYKVRLEVAVEGAMPVVTVPSVALRQALLSLLMIAIHQASSSTISLRARRQSWRLELYLRVRRAPSNSVVTQEADTASLRNAEALLLLCGGTLAIVQEEDGLVMNVGLPLENAVPVLAVDDNRDALQLFERYVASTQYRLISCHNPKQALPLIEKEQPALIVLDVMMSGLDGWQLLRRLREHPASASCPIIVCTVLAQEEVAMSLGAQEFVKKPVSRQVFLQALNRQYATLVQVSEPGRAQRPTHRVPKGRRAV